jgi:hypothetical protein
LVFELFFDFGKFLFTRLILFLEGEGVVLLGLVVELGRVVELLHEGRDLLVFGGYRLLLALELLLEL